MSTREMEMQNIIIINGVRQSGVTTKANELKEKIEGLGLGYKVAIKEESSDIVVQNSVIYLDVKYKGVNYTKYDYIIMERFYDEDMIKILKRIANVKIINLDESDIIMRMIGNDLSKDNVKTQIGNYLKYKRHYVGVIGRWD